jgi:hypothetical protein
MRFGGRPDRSPTFPELVQRPARAWAPAGHGTGSGPASGASLAFLGEIDEHAAGEEGAEAEQGVRVLVRRGGGRRHGSAEQGGELRPGRRWTRRAEGGDPGEGRGHLVKCCRGGEVGEPGPFGGRDAQCSQVCLLVGELAGAGLHGGKLGQVGGLEGDVAGVAPPGESGSVA